MARYFSALLAAVVALSLAFAVYLLIRPPRPSNRPSVILCLGDSMTEGEYGGYPAYLRRLAKTKFPGVRVLSAARPGNNSREYLAFLRNSDLLRKGNPDIVLLMLGTNDVRIDGDRSSLSEFRER